MSDGSGQQPRRRPLGSDRTRLAWLLLAALVTRLALLPWFAGLEPSISDAREYDALATSLARGEGLAFEGEATARRPPLYPAMVALVYTVAGVGDHQSVRLVQVFLGLLVPMLVWALAVELYDRRTAWWAAVLAVLYPGLWGHSYLLLTELPFSVFVCLAVLLSVRAVGPDAGRGTSAAFGAGLATGLGALVRSVLQLAPPVLATVVWLGNRRTAGRRRAAAALLLLGFLLPVLPWIVRNTRLQGTLTPIDTMAARVLYQGSAEFEMHGLGGVRLLAARGDGESEEAEAAGGPARGALRYMVRHPFETAGHALVKAFQFWQLERELVGAARRGWLGDLPPGAAAVLAVAVNLPYVVIVLAAVVGLFVFPARDAWRVAAVLAIPATTWFAHALATSHSRYHVPLIPLFCVFAARALLAVFEERALLAPENRRRLLAAAVVCAVLVSSWVAQLVLFDLPDLLGGPRG